MHTLITHKLINSDDYVTCLRLSDDNIRVHKVFLTIKVKCVNFNNGFYVKYINRDIHEILSHIHEYISTQTSSHATIMFFPYHIIIKESLKLHQYKIFEIRRFNNIQDSYKTKYKRYKCHYEIYISGHETWILKQLYEYHIDDTYPDDYIQDKINYILLDMCGVVIKTSHRKTNVISYLLG